MNVILNFIWTVKQQWPNNVMMGNRFIWDTKGSLSFSKYSANFISLSQTSQYIFICAIHKYISNKLFTDNIHLVQEQNSGVVCRITVNPTMAKYEETKGKRLFRICSVASFVLRCWKGISISAKYKHAWGYNSAL